MSTIRDIARMAGVSVSTASLALNDDPRVRSETRRRVVESATSLDYHPLRAARSLSSGRTWAIQLLNPGIDGSLSSGFFARFVRGMHDAARDNGYSVTLSVPASEAEARTVLKRLMSERWADGVILTNPSEHDALLEDVVAGAFPHVLLGRSPVPGVTTVDNDNLRVAFDATSHLLEVGRRRLVLVNGSAQHTFTRDRAEGFALAQRRAGAEPSPHRNLFGNTTADDARRQLAELLADGLELDGLVAVSDSLALGAMRALAEHGLRVPHDVAVVGMNNDDLTEFTNPTLSSIELNAFELGSTSAELLIKAIAGPGVSVERRIVGHRLVIRDSSAPAVTMKEVAL